MNKYQITFRDGRANTLAKETISAHNFGDALLVAEHAAVGHHAVHWDVEPVAPSSISAVDNALRRVEHASFHSGEISVGVGAYDQLAIHFRDVPGQQNTIVKLSIADAKVLTALLASAFGLRLDTEAEAQAVREAVSYATDVIGSTAGFAENPHLQQAFKALRSVKGGAS